MTTITSFTGDPQSHIRDEAVTGKRKQHSMIPEQESAMYTAASQDDHADLLTRSVAESVLAEETTLPAHAHSRHEAVTGKRKQYLMTPEQASAMDMAAAQRSCAELTADSVAQEVLANTPKQPEMISIRYDEKKRSLVKLDPEEIDQYINLPGLLPENVKLNPEDLIKRLEAGLTIKNKA